jgi:hypothetical protein
MKINMEKTFIRVRSIKDIVIFTSLAIVGIILTVLPVGDAAHIAGFFIIFAAAILAFVLKSAYKDVDTNDKYFKKERYFQQTMRNAISEAIASKPDSVDLSEEDKGNALRLDTYYSKSSGKAYLQLFEYVPYTYQPCSKMHECELSNVTKLI